VKSDILHDFPINAPAERVFQAVASPQGLDSWWTKECAGKPTEGEEYRLYFGPQFDWRAVVSRCVTNQEFELRMTRADQDWLHSHVGFSMSESGATTQVRFRHLGWPAANDHYRTSCYCWAMYLRLLRRYVEFGEVVPYETRLDV
jgi:uncharacterized protein YndB with AHSA1/START domain